MIRLKNLIDENVIDTLQTIGDFSKGSSFTNKSDRALVTHPVAVQKIKDFFKNTKENFDLYFVNTKYARRYVELGEVKESFIFDDLKITPDQLKNGEINHDNITVFFTNNKGDERAPFTPWIMAHRLGHVIRRVYTWEKELNPWIDKHLINILNSYGVWQVKYIPSSGGGNYASFRRYELAKRHLCETLGTFKSARNKNLRNYGEFNYELFAQYLKDGKITLNNLPDVLLIGHAAFGRKDLRRLKNKKHADESLTELRENYEYHAESVLSECVGKIFVM